MANTVERVGLVTAILLGGYATVESIINRADNPNKATKTDLARVEQKIAKDVEVVDTRVSALRDESASIAKLEALEKRLNEDSSDLTSNLVNVAEQTDAALNQIVMAFAQNLAGDCKNENSLNALKGILQPKSLQECYQERVEWFNQFQQK
ncbi:hypothetical protein HYW46_00205 [Candidatus Daviesbacteria bacterium]|nr:hypothetical protein [Candidatus Daviesbacteria bacterium]